MLRPARDIADDGRVDVAIAKLGADHLVRLALLHVGDGCHHLACLPALRRIVADVRAPQGAPLASAEARITRGADVAVADLPSLMLIGGEQLWSGKPFQRRVELPAEI